jgi:EVE domain
MTKCWIGVTSREHVLAAVEGGFCQLNHGKEAPLKRMSPGDRIIYYSPREGMRESKPVRAFTAIGKIMNKDPFQVSMPKGFNPFRRHVRYLRGEEAPIEPHLEQLSFTRGKSSSRGLALRRGFFAIDGEDYLTIANAMNVHDPIKA